MGSCLPNQKKDMIIITLVNDSGDRRWERGSYTSIEDRMEENFIVSKYFSNQ